MKSMKLSYTKMFLLFSFIAFLSTNIYSQEYLARVDKMPRVIGGLKSLNENLVYPDAARNAGLEGQVFVLIFINENGGVDDVKVVKGIGMGCDEAAIEVVKKAEFQPAEHGGKKVKVKFALAIDFKLG